MYIGSSGCAASNREYLPGAVKKLKHLVEEKALDSGRLFAAVGVARDWDPMQGISHLNKFGRFDEVMAGRNWLNVGALKYIYEDIPGAAATPQIVVVDRVVEGVESSSYSIKNEVLVTRKVGTREIRRWLEHGASLPTLEAPVKAGSFSTAPRR